MKEVLKAMVYVIALAIAVTSLIVIGAHTINSAQCRQVAGLIGMPTKYYYLSGCVVRVHDRWVPFRHVRFVDNKVIVEAE